MMFDCKLGISTAILVRSRQLSHSLPIMAEGGVRQLPADYGYLQYATRISTSLCFDTLSTRRKNICIL